MSDKLEDAQVRETESRIREADSRIAINKAMVKKLDAETKVVKKNS